MILSLGGFGLTLPALEARFGRLPLTDYRGLYEHSPRLAVCFLLTGLASVGLPGTLGFISTELLVDSAVEASPYVGIAVVTAAALNGIAVVRAYFLLFTGTRHLSTVSLGIGPRERIAVLALAALIFGGGLIPQPGVATRVRAAEEILEGRMNRPRPAKPAPRSSPWPSPRPARGPDRLPESSGDRACVISRPPGPMRSCPGTFRVGRRGPPRLLQGAWNAPIRRRRESGAFHAPTPVDMQRTSVPKLGVHWPHHPSHRLSRGRFLQPDRGESDLPRQLRRRVEASKPPGKPGFDSGSLRSEFIRGLHFS